MLGREVLGLLAAGLLLTGGALAGPEPRGKLELEPFDNRGVTLEPGPLRRQVEEVKAYYLAIPDDDLLKGFRSRAGRPAPGRDLGGWYSSDTFLVFGQIVSGLARLHAGTGDPACRDKAIRLVDEWALCIEPDGYFYASRKPNAPHYIFDKMVWGLLDTAVYCGHAPALERLSRITDWAVKNLERSRKTNDTSTEWYTLSENLYRAYLITGDPKYRDFAEVWEYRAYWDTYARGGDIFAPRPDGTRSGVYHAYSHVNTLNGAALAYRVKGEAHDLDTIRNAYDVLKHDQLFPTGGYGPDEQLLPVEQRIARLGETHNTFETQCGSWAAFKLAKSLITITGDAQYGDWVERLVLNGIGASIPMTADGRVFYYADYHLHGGSKQNVGFAWSCCTGTRVQTVADYHDLVYFQGPRTLGVNLYTPSTVGWKGPDGRVVVRQETRFPEGEEVRFTVEPERPTTFAVQFRVPGWLARPMEVRVNGARMEKLRVERHWAIVERIWTRGDTVSLRLPMKLGVEAAGPGLATPAFVLYGPVVLGFEGPASGVLRTGDTVGVIAGLEPVAGAPLRFRVAAHPEVVARPFATFAEGERYHLEIDPAVGSRVSHADVTFTGTWHGAGAFRFSNEVGATAECAFEGTGVRWLGWRFDDAGLAEVTIDGKVVGRVSQYGPGRDLPFDWRYEGLAPGRHTIRLRLLEDRPAESRDRFLNVAGFEAIPRP